MSTARSPGSCSSAPRRLGMIERRLWPRWRAIIEHVETIWREPDDGIWEARGPQRHYTYSKVMAWVVFDRAVRLAERFELDAPLDRWKQVRDEIHAEVCERGLRPRAAHVHPVLRLQGARCQRAEHPARRLPAGNRRARHRHDRRGLARARSRRLRLALLDCRNRRRAARATRGSSWPARSGSSTRSRATAGSIEARALFERLVGLANDLGLLAEEYDVARRRQVGNFPQAFSHLTLILAARAISNAEAGAAAAT